MVVTYVPDPFTATPPNDYYRAYKTHAAQFPPPKRFLPGQNENDFQFIWIRTHCNVMDHEGTFFRIFTPASIASSDALSLAGTCHPLSLK